MATLAYNAQIEGNRIHLILTTLDINQTNTDIGTVAVPYGKYVVRSVTVYDASTSLAASAATLGVYTAAAAGGTAVVTPALLTALSASTKYTDQVIAAATDYLTAATLYVRSAVAHGSAATVSVCIDIQRVG